MSFLDILKGKKKPAPKKRSSTKKSAPKKSAPKKKVVKNEHGSPMTQQAIDLILAGERVVIRAPIQVPVILGPDEQFRFIENASASETKTETTGRVTSHNGSSYRWNPKYTYHYGRSVSWPIREKVINKYTCVLFLTNKRFVCYSYKPVDVKLEKITAVGGDENTLIIQVGNKNYVYFDIEASHVEAFVKAFKAIIRENEEDAKLLGKKKPPLDIYRGENL